MLHLVKIDTISGASTVLPELLTATDEDEIAVLVHLMNGVRRGILNAPASSEQGHFIATVEIDFLITHG